MKKPLELKVPSQLWTQLISELRRRGQGRRESGAFLLAGQKANTVVDFVCFDDLDPEAFDTGIITFRGIGFARLWNFVRERGLRVVGDVHAHPGAWVGQSFSDRTNPMINRPGHLALILPCFAQVPLTTLAHVGIYEYRGHHRWKTWEPAGNRVRISDT